MREQVVTDGRGRPVQVSSDGRTVWVVNYQGATIGRFSAKGVDVHSLPGEGNGCLDCAPAPRPFGLPSRKLWGRFKDSMREHHEVEVPDGLIAEWNEDEEWNIPESVKGILRVAVHPHFDDGDLSVAIGRWVEDGKPGSDA